MRKKKRAQQQQQEQEQVMILNDCLLQTAKDLSVEQDLRRKREKSLIKLAKEFHKRTTQVQEKSKRIVELERKRRELETKLKAANRVVVARQRECCEMKRKYQSVCLDCGIRVSEIRSEKETACSKLRSLLIKANTETARLRARLPPSASSSAHHRETIATASATATPQVNEEEGRRCCSSNNKQQQQENTTFLSDLTAGTSITECPSSSPADPTNDDFIPEEYNEQEKILLSFSDESMALPSSQTATSIGTDGGSSRSSNAEPQTRRSAIGGGFSLFRLLILFFGSTAAVLRYKHLASFDAMCSPIRPGTYLSLLDQQQQRGSSSRAGSSSSFTIMEAPWWAPDPWKSMAFATVCGGGTTTNGSNQQQRVRTRLVFSHGKLSLYQLPPNEEEENGTSSSSFSSGKDYRSYWYQQHQNQHHAATAVVKRRRAYAIRAGVTNDRIALINKKGVVFDEMLV